MKAAQCIPYFI